MKTTALILGIFLYGICTKAQPVSYDASKKVSITPGPEYKGSRGVTLDGILSMEDDGFVVTKKEGGFSLSYSLVKFDTYGPMLQRMGDRSYMPAALRDRPGT